MGRWAIIKTTKQRELKNNPKELPLKEKSKGNIK